MPDYAVLAKRHGGTSVSHESPDAVIPPEEQRLSDAIGVRVFPGSKIRNPGGSEAIASVGEHEPHEIEVNDVERFKQGPNQVLAHEITHLLFNNLPGSMQKAVPPDGPDPYNIADADKWRAQGKKLWQLPQEQAAMLVQTWVADPAQRKRLQPWIDDLKTVPLSVERPTAPGDKTLNTTPRTPLPPMEAYQQMPDIVAEATRRRVKMRQ